MDTKLSTDVDYLANRLSPLFREGKPVALTLLVPTARQKEHLLVLTPGSLMGWVKERVVVSVIGQGSTVVMLDTKREFNRKLKKRMEYRPRIAGCVRAGIPAKNATDLVTTLQKLYLHSQENRHANTTSRRTRRPQRSSTSPRPRKYTEFRE